MIKVVKKGIVLPFLLLLVSTALTLGAFFLLENKPKVTNQKQTQSASPSPTGETIHTEATRSVYTSEESPIPKKLPKCGRWVGVIGVISGPFRKIDNYYSAGEVNIKGNVVTRSGEFSPTIDPGQIKTWVYLIIPPQINESPENIFFNYFSDKTKDGNGINPLDQENLLFKIGELKENNTFSSTASVTPEALEKILMSLKDKNEIFLKLKIPTYVDAGVPLDFSFACEII